MITNGVIDSFQLVQIPANKDCVKIASKWSQICTLIIIPFGAQKPTDWTDKDSWDEVILNTALDNQYGRLINCIGGIDEGAAIEVPNGLRVKTVGYQKQLVADLPIVHDWQYNLIQRLQLGQINFSFWFGTLDGRLVGGADGIQPNKVFADTVYSTTTGEYEKGVLKLDWSEGAISDRHARVDLPELVNPGAAPAPVVLKDQNTLITDDSDTVIIDDSGTGLF